jgi:hypothetical protein
MGPAAAPGAVLPSASAGGTERGCVRARLGDSTCRRATRSFVAWTIVSLEKSPLFRNCKLGI